MEPKNINSLAFTFSKILCKNKNAEKSKGKGKCHRPGPLMRNPYLNFLREFRKHNCGYTAVDIIKKGAQAWRAMPKEKRLRYIEEAFYAPKRRACSGAKQSWSLNSCVPKKQHRKSVSSCSSKSRVYKKKSITSSKRGKGCTRKVKSKKRTKKAKKLRCGQRKRFRRHKLKISKSKCKHAKLPKRIKKKPKKCI